MTQGNLYVAVDYGRSGGDAVDRGERPWTREDPPFWANASIWLTPGITKAKVGQPSFIHVRVSNNGDLPMEAVRLQTFLFPAYAGVPWTFGQATKNIGSAEGPIPPGRGTDAPGDANVVTVGPWTPLPSELRGDGHMCVIANIHQSFDGEVPNPEGVEIKSSTPNPFQPNADQHQGQRNIVLEPATQQAVAAPVRVSYTTRPPVLTALPRELLVKAEPFEFDGFSADELFVLALHEGIEVTGPAAGSGRNEVLLSTSQGKERVTRCTDLMSVSLKAEGIPGLDQTFLRDEKLPDELLSELEVQLAEDAPVGSLHTVDVTLEDADGPIGSGLRVMILVTE